MTSNLGSTNYSYDSNYQLTQANYPSAAPFNSEVDSWTYDSIGNRLTNTVNGSTANYTYYKNGSNPLNGQRLQSDGTKTYTFDANGNLISDGTNTYGWHYENRLVSISGSVSATYSYDYLGRRKNKAVGGVTTSYLYDGQNLIREAGTSTIDYAFGPGIDEPLAQNSSAVTNYYSIDGLGSIADLNDTAGALQNSYVYDSWGVVKSQTGTTANSFGYTGREFAEAGLDFYRARYYSPAIGRFISEDPLRFGDLTRTQRFSSGRQRSSSQVSIFAPNAEVLSDASKFDNNVYRYANNLPTLLTDPTGLSAGGASGSACGECGKKAWILFLKCGGATLAAADLAIGPGLAYCLCLGPGAPECVAGVALALEITDAAVISACTASAIVEYKKCKPCNPGGL